MRTKPYIMNTRSVALLREFYGPTWLEAIRNRRGEERLGLKQAIVSLVREIRRYR